MAPKLCQIYFWKLLSPSKKCIILCNSGLQFCSNFIRMWYKNMYGETIWISNGNTKSMTSNSLQKLMLRQGILSFYVTIADADTKSLKYHCLNHNFDLSILIQAKCRPIVWLLYRYLVAIYLTVWLGLILNEFGEEPLYAIRDTKWKWFIQISNWSYIITILYFYVAAFNSSYYYFLISCKNGKYMIIYKIMTLSCLL